MILVSPLIYNHTITNLAFHSKEVSPDKLSMTQNGQLPFRCIPKYMRMCSFIHAYFWDSETKEYDFFFQKFVKKVYGERLIDGKTYNVVIHWNCLYEAIPMFTNKICN